MNNKTHKPLMEVLLECHYIDEQKTTHRYKDILRGFWQDVGDLVTLGLLEEPGIRLFQLESGKKDVSNELSRQLDRNGGRISRQALEGLHVQFALPIARLKQLQRARKRARKR